MMCKPASQSLSTCHAVNASSRLRKIHSISPFGRPTKPSTDMDILRTSLRMSVSSLAPNASISRRCDRSKPTQRIAFLSTSPGVERIQASQQSRSNADEFAEVPIHVISTRPISTGRASARGRGVERSNPAVFPEEVLRQPQQMLGRIGFPAFAQNDRDIGLNPVSVLPARINRPLLRPQIAHMLGECCEDRMVRQNQILRDETVDNNQAIGARSFERS